MAMLRRLEKRVYVPLPGPAARELMLRKKLPPASSVSGPSGAMMTRARDDIDFSALAGSLEGYSGSDIALLCKEAAMRPVRRLMDKLEALESAPKASSGYGSADAIRIDPVSNDDMQAALAVTRPSARMYASKYVTWQAEFAST